jgi:molybdopterin/thiamine biosynthesis adenylyltransferase
MQDDALLRYSRHILLDDIGIEGQERILATHALVIGAGGLGSPVAMYLAAAGVGTISVTDDDTVDLTNLQRQIAHRSNAVGRPKVESLKQTLNDLNPMVQVNALQIRADSESLETLVHQADVVLDCCDNFQTRHAVNAACVRHGKPLVSGAAIQFDGQISVYDTRATDAPCYACTFPAESTFEEVRCSTMGVFAPLVGIIGAMQAAEALKLIIGIGRSLNGRLLMLDGRAMEWNEIRMPRNHRCPVCATRPAGVGSHMGTAR